MDTKTGQIKTFKEFEEDLGTAEMKRRVDAEEIVPVPDGELELVRKMTWREKQNWLNVQAQKRREARK